MTYAIEFIYTDNAERYDDLVELSADELKRVLPFLQALEKAHDIRDLEIYPYAPQTPITFAQLRENWTNGTLVDWGKRRGLKL